MTKKVLKYDKTTFELTDDEAKEVTNFLTSPDRTTHYNFKGQALKSMKMEIMDNTTPLNPIYLDYSWSDEHLAVWGEEVGDNFKKYLVGLKVISNTDQYIIKDRKMYIELQAKWNKLQDLRYRNEKAEGFPTYAETAKRIRKGIADFKNKIDVNYKPKDYSNHKQGCDIQRDKECTCEDYEKFVERAVNKINVDEIPF